MLLAALLALQAPDNPDWSAPYPPFHIAANVYWVGSKDLGAYLIATPKGHILINSNLKTSPPQIQKSVEQLGFRFKDIKILLISHAHFDHCAGSAEILRKTKARYMVMAEDAKEIEDGGRSDFQYGQDKDMYFEPAKVARVLHDNDKVTLGGTTLTAHVTPGHTPGCTTWTLKAGTKNVVIVGSPNVNPGYKLVNNPTYPNIAKDYERTFRTLKALPCDIFLGAHGSYFDMTDKIKTKNFTDPKGYRAYVLRTEQNFKNELKKQTKT